jgi:hypothetical protein
MSTPPRRQVAVSYEFRLTDGLIAQLVIAP